MEVQLVADRVHLISHAHVNCYVVQDDDGLLLVDAGLPSMRPPLLGLLAGLGRDVSDIRALVLTHGHFDHVGFALHAHRKWEVPVLVHHGDQRLAAHPYRYKPRSNRFLYPLTHPRSLPLLAGMAAAGALSVKGVDDTRPLDTGEPLPLPGRPIALHTPGHTDGHCILHLPRHGVVFSGDALVTLDPYTGARGPQIVANAATSDPDKALASLEVLAGTGEQTVLPGHGAPWAEGARRAVDLALATGAH
ncbi:MBL fold metallo-hydrolase [Zafaria cholistanensis]|uniref:MBL fold metallo-hydrolase n=1 Tax=Zafaria cholistanensis TaxID=1682741 RepID=A0A5A7NQD6_9MICC|nr:MBL fold metallo-hydrolase [Zafaria cholistanensis]GER23073.1 MBL fold metallo-hydrolase [Zafaria cholistanensis]